jgi:hypothetical protein
MLTPVLLSTFEFMGMGGHMKVDIIHILAEVPIVMTERVDHFAKDGTTVSLPQPSVVHLVRAAEDMRAAEKSILWQIHRCRGIP